MIAECTGRRDGILSSIHRMLQISETATKSSHNSLVFIYLDRLMKDVCILLHMNCHHFDVYCMHRGKLSTCVYFMLAPKFKFTQVYVPFSDVEGLFLVCSLNWTLISVHQDIMTKLRIVVFHLLLKGSFSVLIMCCSYYPNNKR